MWSQRHIPCKTLRAVNVSFPGPAPFSRGETLGLSGDRAEAPKAPPVLGPPELQVAGCPRGPALQSHAL